MKKKLSLSLRRQIVALHRKGVSQRAVARRLQVSLGAVQRWLLRAQAGEPLQDRSPAPRTRPAQTPAHIEAVICELRIRLAAESDLGFIGPQAIAEAPALRFAPKEVPATRTIARVLARHGLLDGARRMRRPAPPTGWHLPAVALGRAQVDAFDVVEDLPIDGHGLCHALTSKSLAGPLVAAWISTKVTAAWVIERLRTHWQKHGLPAYAQFDNDTRFQGPHNRPNVIGEVMRFCLHLGATPVFAPPRETGFQADMEGFNALWQAKVWRRTHHASTAALQAASDKFCAAYTRHRAARADHAPERRSVPRQPPSGPITAGAIIFIRRTDETGTARILEQSYLVDSAWSHRLVRAELHVATRTLRFYRLRRKDPKRQPLIKKCQLKGTLRLG